MSVAVECTELDPVRAAKKAAARLGVTLLRREVVEAMVQAAMRAGTVIVQTEVLLPEGIRQVTRDHNKRAWMRLLETSAADGLGLVTRPAASVRRSDTPGRYVLVVTATARPLQPDLT